MKLSPHDLAQLNDDYLKSLTEAQRHQLCCRLRDDLIELHDRLNQNPTNSSRPPSSREPWCSPPAEAGDEEADTAELCPQSADDDGTCDAGADVSVDAGKNEGSPAASGEPRKRQAGKQAGTPGHGRTQKLPITATIVHRADVCGGCGCQLSAEAAFMARTGHYVIDIEKESTACVGLQVTNTKHLYGDTRCACGHTTRTLPHRDASDAAWNVELTEWHLVGPLLMALICCLAKRMRMSRARIKEFLADWLGIELAVGTINQCLHEMGRAVSPLEDQLLEEVNQSDLLHADETSWKERGRPLWLWVFSTVAVTLYVVGKRDLKSIEKVLADSFAGWLMSDGYSVYRGYKKRLRCWAHLERKAQGLKESLNQEAQRFGNETLTVLATLMDAIYRVRENPQEDLVFTSRELLVRFKIECERYRDVNHDKTRALAREFLNDWEAIFTILAHPHLPLTNNEAERALRHWVILRKISFGTRTPQGTRVFALVASVIETCRKRQRSPWDYLAQVISARRRGCDIPPIPVAA